MNVPKPLALPHLVQHYNDDPRVIEKALVDSAKSMPPFNYRSVEPVLMDFIRGNFSVDQLEKALQYNAPKGRSNLFAELAAPLYSALSQANPKFVARVDRQILTIPGGLTVPFDPGFVYIPKGEERLILPYRLYWKDRVLNERSLRLFFSLARELQLEDDNIAEAELQLLTMSAEGAGKRTLRIHNAQDFELLGQTELNAFLHTYKEGFELAKATLAKMPPRPKRPSHPKNPSLELFDFN